MAFPWQKMMGKIGNRAGSAVGAGTGAVQLLKGRNMLKAAEEATPSDMDPTQAAFLAELAQKKNALNTGAEYSSSIDAINDKMRQTQNVITANTGGDVGGSVSALLKSQQVGNQGVGQVLAQGQQDIQFNTGIYGDVLNKIAQRRLELGLLDRAQKMAQGTMLKQSGAANLMAGAQSFMDWNGGDQKASNPIANPKGKSASPTGTEVSETVTEDETQPDGGSAPASGFSGLLEQFKGSGSNGFDISQIGSFLQ